jgi:hypothetical protein
MACAAYPYADTTSPIAKGINIAFWNKNTKEQGLFTSAPETPFNKMKAPTELMPLSGKNFLKITSKAYNYVETAQVDFYAMSDGDQLAQSIVAREVTERVN